MNIQDYNIAKTKIQKFEVLLARENQINQLLVELAEQSDNSGPYTTDTRESREVLTIHLVFSKTLGGAPETNHILKELHIRASAFHNWVRDQLRQQLEDIRNQKKEL